MCPPSAVMPGSSVNLSGRRIAEGSSARMRHRCISRRAARIVGVAAVFSVPMIVRGARSAGAAGRARPEEPPS